MLLYETYAYNVCNIKKLKTSTLGLLGCNDTWTWRAEDGGWGGVYPKRWDLSLQDPRCYNIEDEYQHVHRVRTYNLRLQSVCCTATQNNKKMWEPQK
jgi:hypothetical protein